MKNIITLIDNEARISHRMVAEKTDNLEKSIKNIITKFMEDFEEFGKVHFENASLLSSKTNQKQKTYFLNEQQVTLLFTYLRNNETVRNFKIALIKAFYQMRSELYHTTTPTQLDLITPYEVRRDLTTARRLLTLEKKKHEATAKALEAKIKELKETDLFMQDPSMHNHFLDFLYAGTRAVSQLSLFAHKSQELRDTHQSMGNFMHFIMKRHEKLRGVPKRLEELVKIM